MNYTSYFNSDGAPLQQYVPVPYNLYFNVYVMAKNALDGAKIIEQIMPFFTPEYVFDVTLIPEMNETRNIPIVLKSVTCEDKYDGQFTTRRSLIWTSAICYERVVLWTYQCSRHNKEDSFRFRYSRG